MTRGLELHALYAKAMRRLRRMKEQEPAANPLSLRAWLHAQGLVRLEALKVELPPPSEAVFERERDQLLRDLDLFLEYEVRHGTGREPVAFEVAFGGFRGEDEGDELERLGQDEPIEIRLGEQEFKLRGRIDRIDRLGDGAFEVVDYKTGSFYRPRYAGRFRGGRLLQHALYGLAAAELLRRELPEARVTAGTYYFPAAKGGGQRLEIPHPSRATLAAVVADLLDVAASGAFLPTHEEGDCKFCEFDAVCDGVNRADAGERDRAPEPRRRAELKLEAAGEHHNAELLPILRVRAHE
jgi:ATP-dependent helicase/nuclease subunit B